MFKAILRIYFTDRNWLRKVKWNNQGHKVIGWDSESPRLLCINPKCKVEKHLPQGLDRFNIPCDVSDKTCYQLRNMCDLAMFRLKNAKLLSN